MDSTWARISSAAVPEVLAVSILEDIDILWNTAAILSTMQENMCVICAVLDCIEALTIPPHVVLSIIHIHMLSATPLSSVIAKVLNPMTLAPHEAPSFDVIGEVRLLQDIVDECHDPITPFSFPSHYSLISALRTLIVPISLLLFPPCVVLTFDSVPLSAL